ncbi:uncharacterized protein LOC108260023 isoform X3 [Ictalurus punctatus]|uniref:Uncharacterized protein LOC108260023 isoform X3 n=1 Tax=Ictalurus punctatus TaxID=7998 RepID=A0A9F7THC9_ICTPU|nr:uncharacterized protein LOC108260023 isoform X3 [Ictalurus punctatus]
MQATNRHVTEGRGYEGRVSLFTQELERGNISLQLRDCTGSELRHYMCQVTDGDRTEELTVMMGASTWEDSGVDQQKREEAEFFIRQSDKKWTEDERMKMEKSALLAVTGKTEGSAAQIRRRKSLDVEQQNMSGE